jgi:hypothetical protein
VRGSTVSVGQADTAPGPGVQPPFSVQRPCWSLRTACQFHGVGVVSPDSWTFLPSVMFSQLHLDCGALRAEPFPVDGAWLRSRPPVCSPCWSPVQDEGKEEKGRNRNQAHMGRSPVPPGAAQCLDLTLGLLVPSLPHQHLKAPQQCPPSWVDAWLSLSPPIELTMEHLLPARPAGATIKNLLQLLQVGWERVVGGMVGTI